MVKKIISILVILMLAVNAAACSKENGKSADSTSVYEEKEISPDSGIKRPGIFKVNSKKQLVTFDAGDNSPRFVIMDQEGKKAGEIRCDFKGECSTFTLDSQDNMYVLAQSPVSASEALQQIYVYSPSGEKLRTIDLGKVPLENGAGPGKINISGEQAVLKVKEKSEKAGGSEDGNENKLLKAFESLPGVSDLSVDSRENIYLLKPGEGVEMLDKSGKSIRVLGNPGYNSMDIGSDDNLLVNGFNPGNRKSIIEKFNTSSGSSMWKNESESNGTIYLGGSGRLKCSRLDNSVYLMDEKGVKKYDSSGKLIGTELDFKAYSILASDNHIMGMVIDRSGSLYFITAPPVNPDPQRKADGSKVMIYKYILQPNAVKPGNLKELTLSVPSSDRFLETAAVKFHKANPDIKVNIKEYPVSEQNKEDYEKYLKTLSTELMSGKGADIISVSNLPYDKYISKNILANLSEMMAKDKEFDINRYYANILDALKYKGSLYTLPLSFSFDMLSAGSDILDRESVSIDDRKWTWNDFKAIAEKLAKDSNNDGNPELYAFPNVSYINILEYMLKSGYSKFVDRERKQANFTSREFINLLNFIKTMIDKKLINTSTQNDEKAMFDSLDRGSVAFMPHSFRDTMSIEMAKAMYDGRVSFYDFPTYGGDSVRSCTSDRLFAVNKNSKYKEESWRFLKFLLADEMQSQVDLFGFSLNKEAQQQKTRKTNEMLANGQIKIMVGGSGKPIEIKSISQEDIDNFNKLIDGISSYSALDRQVMQIVQDEIKPFISGGKSADEVAKLIQNRVNTYISDCKILIIDDEKDISGLLEAFLLKEGFRHVYKAETGYAGIETCKRESPNAIVLDIMLPDIDGFEVCRKLREFTYEPILFLSAREEEVDKLLGLGIGGDDYVTKPFSPKEVVFRIKAQLRRKQYLSREASESVYRFGRIYMDESSGEVKKVGIPVELTAKEYQLLLCFARNPGRILSKSKLFEAVWGEDFLGDDNTIMVHIRHLREKLEDDPGNPEYIVTVKGLGYKLQRGELG